MLLSSTNNMNKERKKKKDWMAEVLGPLTPSQRLTAELVAGCGPTASPALQRFALTLRDDVLRLFDGNMNGSRAQIDALKSLLKRTDLEERGEDMRRVVTLLCECLLLPGSTTLHRPILAALAHSDHQRCMFHVYLASRLSTEHWSDVDASIVLPSLLDSLMAFPEHKSVIRQASLPILSTLLTLVIGSLEASVTCLANGSAPGSVLTERISRTMASIHAVLGLDSEFLALAGRCEMIVAVASDLLLRGHWLPKETLSSCAATLYAALYASSHDPAMVARQEAVALLSVQKSPPYADLHPLSYISCIRALLQSAPPSALVDVVNGGMLCTTCDIIEATTDPVQKYHALHALTVGLERSAACHSAIQIERDRIYSVLHRSWNDTQPSLMRMAHQAFDYLLSASKALSGHDSFVSSTTLNVLQMPSRRKGRWGALSALIRHWPTTGLMPEDPDPLVRETLSAMTMNPAILTPAATTLGILWSTVNLHAGGWVAPMVERLVEGSAGSRKAVCGYALPSLVSVSLSVQDRQRVVVLLQRLLELDIFDTMPLSSKLDLLATVRRFGLAELAEVVDGRISYDLLHCGIRNASLALRTAALQLACFNPRTTAPPSISDLHLVAEAISLSLRSTSSAERQTMCTNLQRLFIRIRACMKQNSDAREMLEKWTQQALTGLTASLYPGGHYGRTLVALNLVKMLIETFGTSSFFASSQLLDLNRSLLALLTDPWDKVREVACSCAILLSSESHHPKDVTTPSIAWNLLWMPRLKDADGGARWLLINALSGDRISVLGHLLNTLEEKVCRASTHVEDLGKDGFVHGPLLAVRYIVPHVTLTSSLRCRILKVVSRVLELTLPFLSGPGMGEETEFDDHQDYEEDAAPGSNHGEQSESGQSSQAVTCACWMSAKEASLVLGTICRLGLGEWGPMEVSALINIGRDLFRFLLEIKHNGAMDKAQQGVEAVVTSFMEANPKSNSTDIALPDVPGRWLSEALTHLQRAGQGRSDIVRRSGGLPRAIHALLRAKPAGGARLIAMRGDCIDTLMALAGGEGDDGCWPRVHAFNVLRMVLGDADMADETDAYLSRGIMIAISAVESENDATLAKGPPCIDSNGVDTTPQPQHVPWEVRNAAMLLYTTLLVRILGFANVGQTSNYTNRGPTAAEFFANHSPLASFLVDKLESAACRLDAKDDVPPPFLFPILSLLARLKPSDKSTEATESFVSPLLRCAGARNAAVRKGSALALASVAPLTSLSLVLRTPNTIRINRDPRAKENEIHGRLLQIEAALENRQSSHVDVEAVASEIFTYGSRSLCPNVSPIVTSTYFRVILALCHRVKDSQQKPAGQSGCHRCISEAMEYAWRRIISLYNTTDDKSAHQLSTVVIGQDTMLHEAVKLVLLPQQVLLDTFGQLDQDGQAMEERFAMCVQHPVEEIRIAAFQSVTKLMTTTGECNEDLAMCVASVTSTYLVSFAKEGAKEGRDVRAAALSALTEALRSIPVHRRTACLPQDSDELEVLVSCVVSMARGSSLDRLPAVQCLAGLVGADAKWVDAKVAIAIDSGQALQPTELRMGAAAMLSEGGLLRSVTATEAGTKEGFVGAWTLAFALLEDEDEGVRHKAATGVQEVFRKGHSEEELSEEAVLRIAPRELMNLCYMSQTGREGKEGKKDGFDNRLAVVELMCGLILPKDAMPTEGAVNTLLDSDSIRLFDKEADNNHAEPLVTTQAASTALANLICQRLLVTETSDGVETAVKNAISKWGSTVAERVMHSSINGMKLYSFIEMYRVLVVFWVCSHLPEDMDWLRRVLPVLSSSRSISGPASWLLKSLCREIEYNIHDGKESSQGNASSFLLNVFYSFGPLQTADDGCIGLSAAVENGSSKLKEDYWTEWT